MNKIKLFDIKTHFSTRNNIVCIGKSIHNEHFLLVITISSKEFPKSDDTEDETCAIIKHKNKYYKIEVTLFPKSYIRNYKRSLYNTFKLCYKKIYDAYINNEYIINDSEFHYMKYNIPCNVWLISVGYIVGVI